jgi:beta-phosphoglucomutase-like phosphatase (HAD superfamily)
MGVTPERCWAVEDSTNGIRSALAAGMRVVVVPNPDYPPHPDAVGASHLIVTAVAGLSADLLDG